MIRKLEEVSMNAWPSLQTMLVDGWVLRFAEGYTYRANSINPIYPSTEEDILHKIRVCENIYQERNQPTIFKMTTMASPANLDQILEEQGYKLAYKSTVFTLDLSDIIPLSQEKHPIEMNDVATPEWVEDFCNLSNKSKSSKSTMIKMFENSTSSSCFASVHLEGEPATCGLGVVEGDYIGIYDILTNPAFRRQGLGQQVVSELLNWGKSNGAEIAYLQVVQDNEPAINLYQKLGFTEAYPYWYRVKE